MLERLTRARLPSPCGIIAASVATVCLAGSAFAALSGQPIPDPTNPAWLVRYDPGGNHTPFVMIAPGDPEDFLYRGTRNANGTRSGDQMTIINQMKGTGANAIYFQAVRSHGGDGVANHNPFVNSDPAQGLDQDILNQWETWFTEMDNNGIVIYFFFYDDSARIWTGDTVGAAEKAFIDGLVNKFEHHVNLIWCVAEEYEERYSVTRVRNIAAAIRSADDNNHIISVHQLTSTTFAFPTDSNIDEFAMQISATSPGGLHSQCIIAWNKASGRYKTNMSETAYHKTLISGGKRTELRQSNWACAMAGAQVMVIGTWAAAGNPTTAMLQDMGRAVSFFESVSDLTTLSPNDALANGGTNYVLASAGQSYIAYAVNLAGNIGLKSMTAGTYTLRWYDCPTGTTVTQTGVNVLAGDRTWTKPGGIGNELAVYITRTGGSGSNTAPTATPQSLNVQEGASLGITLTYTDPDGPGPYTFSITSPPPNGSLSGSGANRTYTPNTGFTGTDSFQFTVNDGQDTSAPGTVTINVQPATNQAPVAPDQNVATAQDAQVLIQLAFTDTDGSGPYTFTIVSQPQNGGLTGAANDRFYLPASGFVGTDSFTWTVTDAGGAVSNLATVTINVTSGLVITNTSPATYQWGQLDVGQNVYVDRTFTFTGVPGVYVGLDYLMTANNDKGLTGASSISFDVGQDVTVYVAYDDRNASQPSWMSTFVDTGDNLVTSDTTLSLFAKDFVAGTVTLGGNETGANSMYSVVVEAQTAGPGPGDTAPPNVGMTDIAIGGAVTDPTVLTVTIDGASMTLAGGTFNRNISLSGPTQTVTISASDAVSSTTRTIQVSGL